MLDCFKAQEKVNGPKDKTLREQKTLAVCTSTVYALVTLSPPPPRRTESTLTGPNSMHNPNS